MTATQDRRQRGTRRAVGWHKEASGCLAGRACTVVGAAVRPAVRSRPGAAGACCARCVCAAPQSMQRSAAHRTVRTAQSRSLREQGGRALGGEGGRGAPRTPWLRLPRRGVSRRAAPPCAANVRRPTRARAPKRRPRSVAGPYMPPLPITIDACALSGPTAAPAPEAGPTTPPGGRPAGQPTLGALSCRRQHAPVRAPPRVWRRPRQGPPPAR